METISMIALSKYPCLHIVDSRILISKTDTRIINSGIFFRLLRWFKSNKPIIAADTTFQTRKSPSSIFNIEKY